MTEKKKKKAEPTTQPQSLTFSLGPLLQAALDPLKETKQKKEA